MNKKKLLSLVLGRALLVGCLTGCSTAAASQGGGTSTTGTTSPQTSNISSPSITVIAEGGGEDNDVSYVEQFKPYEQFGLTYDASKNELQYNGKVVRWFEDYYTMADGLQVGNDFFNENGVVDVYAIRDLSSFVRSDDGSFDPSGKLIGIKEFSEKEFAARDIEAIKNPPPIVSIAGDPPSAKELEDMAKEYKAFGVTYDVKNNQWYFNGEKVRFFQDVLISNGEGLTSGKFKGAIRTSWSASGSIDIYTVRDFANPDTSGNGTLTGVEKFSQAEFDKRTQSNFGNAGSNSGTSNMGGAGTSGSTDSNNINSNSDIGNTDSTNSIDSTISDVSTGLKEPSGVAYNKGDKVTDTTTKAIYKITNLADANGVGGTVSYVSSTRKKATKVIIPGMITLDGVIYKVTKISARAFKNAIFKEVVIGNNVTSIGYSAFYGCKNLESITIKTEKLKYNNIGSKAFKGIASNAVIKVPSKKLEIYKKLLKLRGVGQKAKIYK